MKKLVLFSLFCLLTGAVFSQTSGGPDQFGYTWRNNSHAQGPVYNWKDITTLPDAVQVTGLTDDNTSNFYPIGFQFPYYWYSVSQFKVGSNGYIIFNNGAMASPFPVIPTINSTNDFVAPFMSDLTFAGAGNTAQCWYWSNLADTLIVSYVNVPFWVNAATPYTGSNSFQVIFAKADSSITFQYMTQTGLTNSTTLNYISTGIENNSGSIGLQHLLNTYPLDTTAVKFYYPQTTSFVVNDASVAYNDNPESGGVFLSKGGAPFVMNAQVINTGNQTLSSFNTSLQMINSSGGIDAQDTLQTSPLTPGQTELLTSANNFSPVNNDTYTFLTTTWLSGDATPTNDIKPMEVIVVDTTWNPFRLGYSGDFPSPAAAGVSWTGGDAGVGVEIAPPFYPCYIHQLEFYITSNTGVNSGFYAKVYDNTGPGNGPGALLDSIYVPSSQVLAPEMWNTVNLTTPLMVNSGSVFIAWLMDGDSIAIGTDDIDPIGNRSYEILGSWAIYRDRENEDLMIRAVASTSAILDVPSVNNDNVIGQFYPSPSNGKVSVGLNIANAKEITFEFYNIQGQMISSKKQNNSSGTQHTYTFDTSGFTSGIYICKIRAGNQEYNRKLIINK